MVTSVRVEGLSRCYESSSEVVWAVRDANFSVASGSFMCIFGASGSGKSTLSNLIAGLDVPSGGTVTIGRNEVSALNEDGRARLRLEHVGVIFQDNNLIEEFTAVENVMLPLEVRGRSAKEAKKDATAHLAAVGLAGLDNRFPAQLSGGQRQRVGIARALSGGRELLVADEPTGALDSINSRLLFALFRELCDGGTTVIVATHERMSQEFADVVFEMQDGVPTETAVLV